MSPDDVYIISVGPSEDELTSKKVRSTTTGNCYIMASGDVQYMIVYRVL